MAGKLCQVVGGPNEASGWVSGKQLWLVLLEPPGTSCGVVSSPGRSPTMGLDSQTCITASSGSKVAKEHMVAF